MRWRTFATLFLQPTLLAAAPAWLVDCSSSATPQTSTAVIVAPSATTAQRVALSLPSLPGAAVVLPANSLPAGAKVTISQTSPPASVAGLFAKGSGLGISVSLQTSDGKALVASKPLLISVPSASVPAGSLVVQTGPSGEVASYAPIDVDSYRAASDTARVDAATGSLSPARPGESLLEALGVVPSGTTRNSLQESIDACGLSAVALDTSFTTTPEAARESDRRQIMSLLAGTTIVTATTQSVAAVLGLPDPGARGFSAPPWSDPSTSVFPLATDANVFGEPLAAAVALGSIDLRILPGGTGGTEEYGAHMHLRLSEAYRVRAKILYAAGYRIQQVLSLADANAPAFGVKLRSVVDAYLASGAEAPTDVLSYGLRVQLRTDVAIRGITDSCEGVVPLAPAGAGGAGADGGALGATLNVSAPLDAECIFTRGYHGADPLVTFPQHVVDGAYTEGLVLGSLEGAPPQVLAAYQIDPFPGWTLGAAPEAPAFQADASLPAPLTTAVPLPAELAGSFDTPVDPFGYEGACAGLPALAGVTGAAPPRYALTYAGPWSPLVDTRATDTLRIQQVITFVPLSVTSPPCEPGSLPCDGLCVDPLTDNRHCGASAACDADAGTSGTACGPGSACLDGVCSSACPSAEVICGGQCVDPATDNRYCGATTGCGVDAGAPGSACGEGSGCSAGSCASICGAAEVFCGTECVDPQTDTTYCGATLGCGVGAGEAGATCATPSTCSGARCTAPLPGGTPRLATGQQHTLFLKSDGTAEGWGGNGSGQLGDNSNASSAAAAVPVELFNAGSDAGVTLLQNIAQLAANASNSAAVKTDGTVWAWGANGSGQVGDGSTSARNGAVQVTALAGGNLTGAAQVAVGASHMVAVKTDGTVWAWGNNASNQLGDGTTSARSGAVQVLTGAATALTGVANVAVGQTHTLALKTDGTVWAWGSGTSGQLGGGTSSNGEYAVQVTGLTGILEIGAGGAPISAALKSDGTVWTWGSNTYALLAEGETSSTVPTSNTPVQALFSAGTPVTNAAHLGTNYSDVFAILGDGTVRSWGDSTNAQRGDGTQGSRFCSSSPLPSNCFPTTVVKNSDGTPLSGIVGIASTYDHAIAIDNQGKLWGWGQNSSGQLGNSAADPVGVSAYPVTLAL